MIDHVGFKVSNLEASTKFFAATLAPLGYQKIWEGFGAVGFGAGHKPDFWISEGTPAPGVHIAISSDDRKSVDAFHGAGLEAGGTDNGGPGVREDYHPNYYGAFILCPDGYNIEAVCHKPADAV